MSKLKATFAITLALVVGLFSGLLVPAIANDDKPTNYVNLTSDYITDLNLQPALDTAEYDVAYTVLSESGVATKDGHKHIRFMGYSDHMFATDTLFTITDPKTESVLVFISLPNDEPTLALTGLIGNESELLSANVIECDDTRKLTGAENGQIDPCIIDNVIYF